MQVTQIVSALFLSLVAAPTLKAQTEIDELARALTVKIMAPDLYGGRPATEKELRPVTFMGFCTTTIIGTDKASNKSWWVTASHCVENQQKVNFKTRDGQVMNTICARHDLYNDSSVIYDFAICESSSAVPDDYPLAEIDNTPMKVGDGLIMNGYGKPNIGKLHVGSSVVYQLSSQDIITETVVALGSGDSGGALLRGPTNLETGPFKIVGINSRRAVGGSTKSYFNRIELEKSFAWFKKYAEQKNAKLCGVNVECGKAIPPPQIPERCLPDQEMVKYFGDELKMAQAALNACVAD